MSIKIKYRKGLGMLDMIKVKEQFQILEIRFALHK